MNVSLVLCYLAESARTKPALSIAITQSSLRGHQDSKTQINQHEEHLIAGFLPIWSTISASRRTYKKLSSKGLDLFELEPKPVDHRQISIDRVQAKPVAKKRAR